jgi:hypothetical protein
VEITVFGDLESASYPPVNVVATNQALPTLARCLQVRVPLSCPPPWTPIDPRGPITRLRTVRCTASHAYLSCQALLARGDLTDVVLEVSEPCSSPQPCPTEGGPGGVGVDRGRPVVRIHAHRAILCARSPVFRYGPWGSRDEAPPAARRTVVLCPHPPPRCTGN